tara:strand:- start:659 stop:1513 length:855 start_codon:yes stop_codon:yes gene_type:complete
MVNKLLAISLISFFLCCNQQPDDRVAVAKVFDDYLYLDQIPVFDINIINHEDSAILVNNFINQWAKKKLLLKKAEFNIDRQSVSIDSLVEIYKESLLMHYYKEAVIQTYLDTLIVDSLVVDYYNHNMHNFQLQEDIVKLNYIKIRQVAPNLDFVAKSYFSKDLELIEELEDYCFQFADRFFLSNNNWISWPKFIKQLPESKNISSTNLKAKLSKYKKIELEDSTYKHFIFIKDFRLKGTSSPLEYVSSGVEAILINRRKKEIINSIEYKLLEEAIENDDFELYN